jgi:hypothetical protein
VTQALLEEIELIMSIVCQLFMQAHELSNVNHQFLHGLKDCLFFGVSQIF